MTATAVGVDAESTSKFIDIPGYRIHLHEAGSGHPIVLLHGSGPGATGWSNFSPNIGPLAEQFRVIAVDMPGWGESSTVPEDVPRNHPANLIAVLDELGIEKAALVGNSMGGHTSIVTAALYPERVSHLITMGAPSPGPALFAPGGGATEGLKVLFGAYQDPTPENFKRLVQIMCYDPAWATDELAELRSTSALKHPEHLDSFLGHARNSTGALGWQGADGRLGEITAPALLIHGRDDRVLPLENGLRLLASIPKSRLVLFNRCGHWTQIEYSAEFNRIVEDFVANE